MLAANCRTSIKGPKAVLDMAPVNVWDFLARNRRDSTLNVKSVYEGFLTGMVVSLGCIGAKSLDAVSEGLLENT